MTTTAAAQMTLRSVHTTNFPPVLRELGISLVVSTYQSGQLVLVRADGDTLNTHFREFQKPMGVAVSTGRLAVGTGHQLLEMCNVPAVSSKLEPPDKHDACYLPRWGHVTGDIDIHELAYVGDELWFVNTRFSCLCTLDPAYSFVPRWRPPFVSAYDLTDRCHLNGLAVRDGPVRYITALGETDTPGGWRANKASGGILMDIASNTIVCRGLSMPHSPRWYAGQLWVLESGKGTLSRVDPETGATTTVAELPGFTRGLDFYGRFAFIGLSQVREAAVFAGLPVTERVQERNCGVWIVNIDSGAVLGFLRFEEAVQEIFAVAVLPGIRYPELITADEKLIGQSYVLPDAALAEVAQPDPEGEPNDLAALLARGDAAYEQRDLDRAAEYYARCLEADPEYVTARYNLGVVEVERERWPQARETLERVVVLDPGHPEAHNNLGIVAQRTLHTDAAIDYYRKAIDRRFDFPDAHFNLGMALLQRGQFTAGFEESEWRWRTRAFTPFDCPLPRWDGGDISDRTILVHTEQGMGDAMQFIRYMPLLAARCRRTIVVCPSDVVPVFETVAGIDELRGVGPQALDSFDVYAPLLSLPHLFGTVLETVPAQVPYISRPEGRDAAHWRIGNEDDGAPVFTAEHAQLRVGFAWAGSPTHKDDRNRSCRLQDFFDLLRIPEVSFYSLQKQASETERAQLAALGACDLSPYLKDFGDMAAALAELDLVVSVDTSVVHLAGAMAKPVWTLLSYCPDWRWMLEREDTPWYPTMRLYRQAEAKAWPDVLDRIQSDLEARAHGTAPAPIPASPARFF